MTYDESTDADLLADPDRYRRLVAVRERDGLLEEGGALRPAMDAGAEETHRVGGTEVTIRPALERLAHNAGFTLGVPATNEAGIRFLGAHGWNTEAIRWDRYRIDGGFVDEVTMAMVLD